MRCSNGGAYRRACGQMLARAGRGWRAWATLPCTPTCSSCSIFGPSTMSMTSSTAGVGKFQSGIFTDCKQAHIDPMQRKHSGRWGHTQQAGKGRSPEQGLAPAGATGGLQSSPGLALKSNAGCHSPASSSATRISMSGSCSGERTCTVTTTRKHVCNVMIPHTCRASCLNSVLTRSCQVSPACPTSPLGRLNSLDPPWEWPPPAAPTQTAACCARTPRPDPCPSAPPGWQSAASRAGPASKGG